MDFKEFRDEIKKSIAEKMENGTRIEDTGVKKLQGESYQGITVRPEDSIIGVNISIEDAYKAVESGSKTVDEVVGEIVTRLEAALEGRPTNIDINTLAERYWKCLLSDGNHHSYNIFFEKD